MVQFISYYWYTLVRYSLNCTGTVSGTVDSYSTIIQYFIFGTLWSGLTSNGTVTVT